jgi:DNA-binding response OmpR family regulator
VSQPDPRPRVLVVDDEPAIRLLCRVNLEAGGFRVEEAGDGSTALAAARRERPAIVLLDVMMPGEDGFGVAAAIRAESNLERVPVIFLTARADLDDPDRVRRAGADAIMTKPFNPADLVARVRELLAR